jgi:hypothetical protein
MTLPFRTSSRDQRTWTGGATAGDPRVHDAYLSQIQDLAGGAVVAFITTKGQQISNYRCGGGGGG